MISCIFIIFLCVFDYAIVIFFIFKCLYWFFVCFIHVFSFNWCMRGVLDLIKWRVKLCQSKEASKESCRVVKPLPSRHRDLLSRVIKPFTAFTSRQAIAESSPNVAVTSRQLLPSRQASWLFKELLFSALSSFRISVITSSTDVQMQWLKMIWKDNSETYNSWKKFP